MAQGVIQTSIKSQNSLSLNHWNMYIASEELRREIHEGLQVVENWNSANSDLFYGSAGTLKGSDRESQEVSMLALHLLQSALVYPSTPRSSRTS